MGAFNDNVFKNALVILITYKSYIVLGLSVEQMVALCGGIFILPFFLFSSLAGQLADSFSKSRLVVFIKLWEVLVMIVGAWGFATENIHLLLFALFMMGTQSTFFGPIKYSCLPELIDDSELVAGNALVEMGTFVSILVGTILGGLLITTGSSSAIYISSAVILFALIGLLFSCALKPLPSVNSDLKIDWNLFRSGGQIISIARRKKDVWLALLGISWFWFLGAALLSIFPVYVKQVIGGEELIVTLFLAVFSIGVAVGSMLCEKLSRDDIDMGIVPFGALGMALFILDLWLVGCPESTIQGRFITLSEFLSNGVSYRILFDLSMVSIFGGFFIVPLFAYIQRRSDRTECSRVIAANNIINALFMVVSSLFLILLYGCGLQSFHIYGILAFISLAVFIYSYFAYTEKFLRFIIMFLVHIVFRLKHIGLGNIPKEGAAVLVGNHVSFVDWCFVMASSRRPIRFVMHYTFMNVPVIKYLFKGAKIIQIAGHREDSTILSEAMEEIHQALKNGELVCIYPEGEITRDGNIASFKSGIERIIARDPVPVIPMGTNGLWGNYFSRKYGKACSKHSLLLKIFRSKVELVISQPIEPEDVSASILREKVIKLIK